jgi:hypothetical protein
VVEFYIHVLHFPSWKNEKTIYRKLHDKYFIASTQTAKKKKQYISYSILGELVKRFSPHEVRTGDVIPLDDSLAWIGFPECEWMSVDSLQNQGVLFSIQKSEQKKQRFVMRLSFLIYKSLHRDGDNILGGVLDAYLDAVAGICGLSRNDLRKLASRIAK